MSGIQTIRNKINSIRNIQKIAKAMEMISASKMYKIRKQMLACTPYITTIHKIINHIASGQSKYKHPYFIKRKNIKCVGYWVISTDRGLAGGLNINLFRILLQDLSKWNQIGVTTKLAIFGLKAISFFKNIDTKIVSCISNIGDTPKISELIGSVRVMLQLYDSNKIDQLYLIHNKFFNTLTQIPQILQILPITPKININTPNPNKYWDYLYEPDSKYLLNILLIRYIESQIYQGMIENITSEQSARMIAMKSAADNGDTLIHDFQLHYNKIRQTKITQELTEIISGASVI